MNIKITHSWLLEYLDTTATPFEIQKYLSLSGPSVESVKKVDNDYVYDIEITSNRIDAASVFGIAREAAVILKRFGLKAKLKPLVLKEPILPPYKYPLIIDDSSQLCKRILAIVMEKVEVKPSPTYIKNRLELAGIRSLNNLVDITNYIMLEVGHPSHVFDYDRIPSHHLILRNAKKNEKIVTLDEKKYNLNPEDIIIDDGTGRVIDLPGIMGTANSVVVSKTNKVIFFIESNDPIAIRRSSMRYGIRTLAATINEKNPDPNIAYNTFLRGVELYQKIAGARLAYHLIDIYPNPKPIKKITTSFDFINSRIGVEIGKEKIISYLTDLGFKVTAQSGSSFSVIPPSFRANDIAIPEDLVEEIARIHGYHNLPNNLPPAAYVSQPKETEKIFDYQSKIKYFLKHLGLNEVMNYSMISKEMIEKSGLKISNHLRIKNSISNDIEYLRTHLSASLIKNIKDNEVKKETLRFFEIAKTYKPVEDDLPIEKLKLGIVVNTDLFDLKGIIDALFKELNINNCQIVRSNEKFLLKNQGQIFIGEKKIGQFGQIETNIFICVFDFESLINHAQTLSSYTPPHPYAVIKLDLTILLDKKITYERIKMTAFKTSKLLQKIEVISLYQDKLSLRFFFSSPKKNITEKAALSQLKSIQQSL